MFSGRKYKDGNVFFPILFGLDFQSFFFFFFILMKIKIIYRMINALQSFLNLGSVAFLMFCLNFIETIPTKALEFLLDPINSFKTLTYCRDAY